MQIRLSCSLQKLVKYFPCGEKPEYIHQNTSVGDLVEKLDDLMFFGLKYVNLC